ncbi:MAG TPA: ABC transporter permease subunit [Candidatus Limnocylindrales bacterium]|jgi:putative spermidine/putrescine transport system permease protein|nr:ABC transporter permease subunit [Candidatus Limnocylindrales bacterium]
MDQLTLRQPVLTGEATSAPVKRGREAGFLALFLVFALYLIVPMIGMALFSVGDSWIDTVLPRRFTLDYWTAALNNPLFLQTFSRSFIASAGTIALSLVLMTPTLFVLHVAAPRLRPFVEVVSLAPFALPTVVFALSLIRTYSVKPLVLTGTPLLLVLSYTVISLPFVYRAIDNSLRALDTRTLYEAAQTLGASRWEPFRSIILPNIRRGLLAASLLVLSTSFGEYTLSAFLVGDAWKTSGVWIYDFWSDRPHETLALGTISFVVTWAASLAILALLGRRSASEVGRA